jgi:hypothetical protein
MKYTEKFQTMATFAQSQVEGITPDSVDDRILGSMRSSLAARLNILKSPMSVSNVAGLSLFYH